MSLKILREAQELETIEAQEQSYEIHDKNLGSREECEKIFGVDFWKVQAVENRRTWSVDPTLATNLLMMLHWRKHYNGDVVIFIDGVEGTGKSTLARMVAKLLDPTFDHTRIVYSMDGLKRWYFDEKPWTAAIYDESQEGVDRLDTLTANNKEFSAMMRQSRQAHKILIMCGPSIYDISSYVAQHRVEVLLHCYLINHVHPGAFLYYGREGVRNLFVYHKKYRNYGTTPVFNGRFPNAMDIVDMDEYERRKKKAWKKFNQGTATAAIRDPADIIREFTIARVVNFERARDKSKGLTVKDFCASFDISSALFYKYLKQMKPDLAVKIESKEDEMEATNFDRGGSKKLRDIQIMS